MSEPASAAKIRFVALLDTETTGTDPAVHKTIEVAVTLFDVKLAQPVASFASLIQAESNEAFQFNGIPPEMLLEARKADEVWRAVKWIIGPAQAIVAHQASFDKQFCPPLERPFLCTMTDIVWPKGRRSNSLVALALSFGVGVVTAHRATADVDTLSRILTRAAETGCDLEALFIHALRPKTRVIALAPYEEREIVKSFGFQWDKSTKQWWRDMPPEDIAGLPFKVRQP
jgi:DNA polymerase III subunit epsilon